MVKTRNKGDRVKTRKAKKVLGYSGTVWLEDRTDVRIIGAVTKKHFIETVAAEFFHTSKNWIKQRICETGNKKEIELANSEVGTIFVLKVNGFSVDREKVLRRLK